MAKALRTILPEHPHHLVLRGSNRRALFSQAPDYRQFIFFIGRALLFSPVELYAATLMTNHVHLVVRTPDALALPRFVKHLSQRYAQWRNKRREGTGHLFDARYTCKPILSDEQLAVTLAYVELNPVRAGMVDDAACYRWSTFACHAQYAQTHFPRALWTPSPWYLELGASVDERARRYEAWVSDCRARDVRPETGTRDEIKSVLVRMQANVRLRRPDQTRAS